MNYKILLLSLLLSVSIFAQQKPNQLFDFGGGMNTAYNPFYIGMNQSQICMNLLLDDPIGSLSSRYGYITTNSDGTIDIQYSIFGHKFSNNNKFLYSVLEDSSSSFYSEIRRSKEGSSGDFVGVRDADTTIGHHIYSSSDGNWIAWLDRIYYIDGHNRERVIYDGVTDIATDSFKTDFMIPASPGQPIVYNQGQSGNLNGIYIYAFLATKPCSTSYSKIAGDFSRNILFENEQANIRGVFPELDAECGTAGVTATYGLLRTRANKTEPNDSLFLVGTFQMTTANSPYNYNIADNKTDASLDTDTLGVSTGEYWGLIKNAHYWINVPYTFYDPLSGNDFWSYTSGCPTLLTADTGSNSTTIQPDGYETAYFYYAVTFLDTLRGVESGLSGVLPVWLGRPISGGTALTAEIDNTTLGLPMLPDEYLDRYVRVIYRATVDFDDKIYREQTPVWYPLDTVTSDTQTTYWDTMLVTTDTTHWGIVSNNFTYSINTPISHFVGGIVHEARLFTWDRERVYYSNYDTTEFSPLTNITFDTDDGDQIIGIASFEGYIVVYKTKSVWILYTQNGVIVDRSKRSVGYGMVSFKTLDNYHGANIYLSKDGVIFESDSRYRDNKTKRGYISDPIKNLIVRDIDDMTQARAKVVDDMYLLTFPGIDSTFVYFFKTGGWGIWDYSFLDATSYDTTNSKITSPLSGMYFIKNNNGDIYAISSADTTDDGTDYEGVWEKKYLDISQTTKIMESIHLYKDIIAPDDAVMSVIIEDNNGIVIDSLVFDSLNYTYDYSNISYNLNSNANWFTIRIRMPNLSKCTIYGIEFNDTPAGAGVGR